jgi:hypothetical protein
MFTAATMYGTQAQIPAAGVAAVTQPMGISFDDKPFAGSLIDPHNPLMWFGVFLLATVGAAGVSGSARLGKAEISAAVGA